jgi:hypothetical protein
MTGDTVNAVYELFMFAAREHFASKRYMLSVATMAQAWEVFFATFAAARFVFAPFFASPDDDRDTKALNGRLGQLDHATKHFAFARWRNLLLNSVAHGINPGTMEESERAIQQIVPGGLGKEPPAAVIAAVCAR